MSRAISLIPSTAWHKCTVDYEADSQQFMEHVLATEKREVHKQKIPVDPSVHNDGGYEV